MEKDDKKDIRFKQRFANFEKAYARFESALREDTAHNELLRAALIQTFEYTYELAWKTMKDRLEYGGIVAVLPRDVIKEAFQAGFISEASSWIRMMEMRNELAHGYSEELSLRAERMIRRPYAQLIADLHEFLKKSA